MIVRQYTFVDMMVIIIYFFKTIRLLRTTGSVEREEEKKTEGVRLLWKCAVEMTIEIKHIYIKSRKKNEQLNGMDCEFTMCCTKTKYRTVREKKE